MEDYSVIFDGLLIILLVVFLYYALLLNRRLGGLRESKGELEKVINTFADATTRADKSIAGFKSTAEQSGKNLQELIDKAQILRDDLAFMIEKADLSADQLEGRLRHNKPQLSPEGGNKRVAPSSQQKQPAVKSAPPKGPGAAPAGHPQMAANPADAEEQAGGAGEEGRGPSKAEKELMKALQSLR